MTSTGALQFAKPVAALAAVLVFLAACVTDSPPLSDTESVYHHNWWNYYERGVTLLNNGNIPGARDAFEMALGTRAGAKWGNPKDAWRVRTYGMHFVENYFPNRELGVCFFKLGDETKAAEFLQRSLMQTPSGRAKHYLNASRTKKLAAAAHPPPLLSIHIAAESEDQWTPQRARILNATITGEGSVRQVAVGDHREFIELAEPTYTLARNVPLHEGRNAISVSAVDLLGRQVERTVVWRGDWQPPTLSVVRLTPAPNGVHVEAVCSDDQGIASVMLDGNAFFTAVGDEPNRSVTLGCDVTGNIGSVVVIRDLAGNTLETRLDRESLMADASRPLVYHLAALPVGAADETANDGAPRFLHPAGVSAAADRLRPSVRLQGIHRCTEVFDEEFFLDGEVTDPGGIGSIRLCGEEQLAPAARGAVRSYFARRLELNMGTNQYELVAADVSGNATTNTFVIVRRKADYLDEKLRLGIALPPLRHMAEDGGIEPFIRASMEKELLRKPIRFRLVERDEGWNWIMGELNIATSDLVNPQVAIQLGKLVPADLFIFGSVDATPDGVTVYARVARTESGVAVASSDVYFPSAGVDQLDFFISGLTMKIKQAFPLLDGRVSRVTKENIFLDLASPSDVDVGTPLIVLRPPEGEAGLSAGKVCSLGAEQIQLTVDRVRPSGARATIAPADAGPHVQVGDFVYAR